MTYKIARDGQEFGPYSLADVQRYVGTGNILLTDYALAEGSSEWIPVGQVVGTIPAPLQQQAVPGYAAPPGYAGVSGYAAASQYPDAPDMNWAIVLLLDVVTCGIFNIAWNLIQALWMKKVQPETKSLTFYFLVLALAVVNIATSVARMALVMHGRSLGHSAMAPLIAVSAVFTLAALVMQWIVYPFAMRASLLKHFNEADPIGLQLSAVMTFFFGSLYFQYHLTQINERKRAYRPLGA